MDLTQSKLSRSEWETIEVPVSESEKEILNLITKGYSNVNICYNESQSLFSFMKIEKAAEIEFFLYKKYFEKTIFETVNKYGKRTPLESFTALNANANAGKELKSLKSADSIRIENLDNNIQKNKSYIFEYILLDLFKSILKNLYSKKEKYSSYLYTIIQLKKASINNINKYVSDIVDVIINHCNSFTKTSEIISNAYEFIEKNPFILKYQDKMLFSHQKELFTICRKTTDFVPKLILYTAPTGTGKTLSPIGLSENYRIIFVCVARHIGLALAKSAISVEKKVAFAFGCDTASDIRLHYFSAINYTRNRRSGGIGKVDNSVGDNVEIMICDVQSYITAMHYMLSFNKAEKIITYWDEPTITMDYENHELHDVIHKNWMSNKIPTMVLSCATLPAADEIHSIFDDFRCKFDNAEIHSITSFDCKKSIPILNKDGFSVLPHYLYSEYNDLMQCVDYCLKNKTLLRYFDLREIIRLVEYINSKGLMEERYSIDSYFSNEISNITMNSLKEYYLDLLLHLNDREDWPHIYEAMSTTKKRKYTNYVNNTSIQKASSVDSKPIVDTVLKRMNSVSIPIGDRESKVTPSNAQLSNGISLTTSDAYSLTDGPTIFLAEDVKKIGAFYIQQSNIPSSVFSVILSKIIKNGELINKIEELEGKILFKESKTKTGDDDDKKGSNDFIRESGRLCKESQEWMDEINKLRKEIRLVSLDPVYTPNTRQHQQQWAPYGNVYENAFASNISEDIVKTIMMLNIENNLKVLLLLGIGMFADIKNAQYMEIMKTLADQQKLFIIIASTDYIYGTNYQFCHGFIGKDLTRMTQQKTLQAMGRIGRNNIQQDYSIRFRDDDMILQLFQKQDLNLEANNMCKLFCSE
jgi:hypothetical protein